MHLGNVLTSLCGFRVINSYLVTKFGCNSTLIPADLKVQATMERLLHFDIGTLYPSMINYYRPQLLHGKLPDPVHGAELERCLGLLDIFLRDKEYVAGTSNRTLADLSLLASVTQLEGYDYSYNQHRNVTCWANRLKQELPYYHEVSDEGIERSRAWAKQVLKALKCK
ncbi:glutathione S-transferase D5 isoform X2 [Anabrus simplex]|uniref:glutathione S-transferase D5 isoform X2 n=1 Tax=Anabrus simplex TaxID=316456 RepID=UPI0035A35CEA